MRAQTIMAVGAHIGDMDLTAGPVLAQNVLDGGRSVLVALTPGERGHPRLSVDEYRDQKIAETQSFARTIGAEVHVFDDLSDGFLAPDDVIADRLAMLMREERPDLVLAHWRHSMHSDHEAAAVIAGRARFLSGLPGYREQDAARHGVGQLLHTENWEDAEGYIADLCVTISDEAFARWREAISAQAFARGETYGFRYIDYYVAQMTLRGCLAGTSRAVALSDTTFPSMATLA
ncbi:MAG: PIG-L family deacetylase [Brachybacterium sp.]|nr:PIG-L family deacetylase [Brachybacterium sp.]